MIHSAVNNAVKHGLEPMQGIGGTVTVSVRKDETFLLVTVTDNGRGINQTQNNSGNGLKNMHQRAIEINAELKVESTSEKGTNIALLVQLEIQ